MQGYTNFPNGLTSFGVPVLPGGIPATMGDYYFVHSGTGSSSNSGTSPGQALATIDQAINKCTANQGDVIIVMPGHAETVSAAGGIAADIAGISIIGLGWGNLRPLITLSATASTIAVSAANVTFRNLRITTSIDAVVKVFNITAAGCTIDAVDFVETAACACLQFILTTDAADDLTVQNCSWTQTATAATALMRWILLVGTDRAKIRNNFAHLSGYATANPANGVIVGLTTASLNVEIVGNRLIIINSTGNIPLSLLANTTGYVAQNYTASTKTAIAGGNALASCYGAENYHSNTVNVNGLLDPVVDS